MYFLQKIKIKHTYDQVKEVGSGFINLSKELKIKIIRKMKIIKTHMQKTNR